MHEILKQRVTLLEIAAEPGVPLLLERIEQRYAPIRTVILQPRLIVRQSSGAD